MVFFFRLARSAARRCLSFSCCSSFISCVRNAASSHNVAHSIGLPCPRRRTSRHAALANGLMRRRLCYFADIGPFLFPEWLKGHQAIVEIALTQVGNVGGDPYWSWWGLSERAEWCAMFVSWCADQAGLLDAKAIPKFENCVWGANWFKDNAGWAGGSAEPSPRDIIFFDWEPDGYPDHVGIVEKCEGGLVYTIEGNVNDGCAQGRYHVGDVCIFGYGLPAY